jgi:hypothetical protein
VGFGERKKIDTDVCSVLKHGKHEFVFTLFRLAIKAKIPELISKLGRLRIMFERSVQEGLDGRNRLQVVRNRLPTLDFLNHFESFLPLPKVYNVAGEVVVLPVLDECQIGQKDT